MFFDSFQEMSVFDKSATIALWLTLGIVALVGIILLVVNYRNKEKLQETQRFSLVFLTGYAVALLSILLFMKLDEYIQEGYVDYATFIPVVVVLCLGIVFAIIGLLTSIFSKKNTVKIGKILLILFAVILSGVIIYTIVKQYIGNSDINVSSEVGLYLSTAAIVAIIIAITLICGKRHDHNHTKSIVYAGMCIAMSFALSYIRFLELPEGGSITLASLLPIMIYSYMFGIKKGTLVGVIYGLFQFIQAPWFYHPVQFLLDYPIAFASIGITGILHEVKVAEAKPVIQFAIGATIAVILRYFSHVISGIFVFGSGDPENYGAVAWSFHYNSFAFADLAVALLAGCAIMASKQFRTFLQAQSIEQPKKGASEVVEE